jgi:hypothetical protein
MSGPAMNERLADLLTLEHRHGLFDHRVDGWSAWRVMRFPVFQLIEGLPLSTVPLPPWRRVASAAAATLRFAWLLLRAPRRELMVKTYRSALRVREGDRWCDVYFDCLLQRRGDALKLEVVNSFAYAAQAAMAWRAPDLDAVIFTFWGRVLGRLMPVNDGGFCDATARTLAAEAGLQVSPTFLRSRLCTVYWQVRLYSWLLMRVRPRNVLVADTGDYALSIACRRRNVRFIEMQHGVFDARHADAVPAWVQGSDAELVLPERLACFGDYWVTRLAGTRLAAGIAVPTGNPVIDRMREQQRLASARDADVVHLVVTSQGLDRERLEQWLLDMLDAVPAGRRWRLTVKLHPAYDEGAAAYGRLASRAGVTVVPGPGSPNVFELLVDADLHLSIASACHYDAVALGVPTLVVPLAGHESMLDALDGRDIRLAATPASVWESADPSDRGARPRDRGHRFARPGWIDNLEGLLA